MPRKKTDEQTVPEGAEPVESGIGNPDLSIDGCDLPDDRDPESMIPDSATQDSVTPDDWTPPDGESVRDPADLWTRRDAAPGGDTTDIWTPSDAVPGRMEGDGGEIVSIAESPDFPSPQLEEPEDEVSAVSADMPGMIEAPDAAETVSSTETGEHSPETEEHLGTPDSGPVSRRGGRSRTVSTTASDASSASPASPVASASPAASRRRSPARTQEEADRAAFFRLDFNDLDRNLSPEQRKEWNSIYASYRGRSVMSGVIAGIDPTRLLVRDPDSGVSHWQNLLCAVVIPFRVRILIPPAEMWFPGEERPDYVMKNMMGAPVDFVIIRVDRLNDLAVASRRLAMPSRRYFFSTQPAMNRPGSRIQCSVLSVGSRRCLLSCNGYDVDLTQRDLSWHTIPDLKEVYHAGDTLDCVVKEYNSRENRLVISVKEVEPNPFEGAEARHPAGCTRQAVISGKYGGGVFCTLPDNVTVMCNYAFHYDDSVFSIGERVIVMITRYQMERHEVFGKIVAKC